MELLGQRKWGKKEKIHECSEVDMKMVSVTEEDVRERDGGCSDPSEEQLNWEDEWETNSKKY